MKNKNIENIVMDYILQNENYFKSPNVETEKTPDFLVYISKGNNKESLNIYFDYKTSKQFINRAIFCLGHYLDFSSDQIKELERLSAKTLNSMGVNATRAKDTYQSEGD